MAWIARCAALPTAALVAGLIAGCGGGSSVGSAAPQAVTTAAAAAVEGAVVKGPVAGAQVCAYALAATGRGDALGCATTGADGRYALRLPHSGPILLEATGGTYTDEASGQPGVALTATLTAVGLVRAGQPAAIVPTPLTTLAVRRALASGFLDPDSYAAAAAAVASAFGLTTGALQDGQVPDVGADTTDAHGRVLRGISRMLQRGATLDGLLRNPDLAALQAGYEATNAPACVQSTPLPGRDPGAAGGLVCMVQPDLQEDGTVQRRGALVLPGSGALPPPPTGPLPPGGTLVITGPGRLTVTGAPAAGPTPTLNSGASR